MRNITIILLITVPNFLFGQLLVKKSTEPIIYPTFSISIEKLQEEKIFKIKHKTLKKEKIFKTIHVDLKDADMVVTTVLSPPDEYETYGLRLILKDTFGRIINPATINDIENISNTKNKRFNNKITWKNMTEGKIFPRAIYDLDVVVDLYTEIDCSDTAKFDLKEHLWFAPGLLIGGGLMVISDAIIKPKAVTNFFEAERASNAFTELWENGTIEDDALKVAEENEHLLAEGRKFNKRRKKVFWTGVVVLAVNALVYADRLKKHIVKKNRFEKYCGGIASSLQIDPILNLNTTNDYEEQIGLNLTYTF